MIDVERARDETPGCREVVHLNNAGAALPPQVVLDAQIDHLELEATIGGYEAADARKEEIEGVYGSVARLLGCSPEEVAIVDNATRAWDLAFYAIDFDEGDRILTSRAEYVSNVIAFLQVAERTGAEIEVVPDDDHGQLSVDALRQMIDERVKLIAVTHVPTQGGLVNPAARIGAVAKEAGITFLLDACQSVGQLAIDVDEVGCDVLSATGRKFLRGPRGTGFLYVRETIIDQLEPPVLDLRSAEWVATDQYRIRPDARRFETWEKNYAAVLGLGAAVDYALGWGMEAIEARVTELAERLRVRLSAVDGVSVHDLGEKRCGIVSLTVDGVAATEVMRTLREAGINTSVSRQDYARFDLESRGLGDIVRASVHYYNTEDELERLCDAVTAAYSKP